jgi:glycerophosphoryl diester phosphodiesterase
LKILFFIFLYSWHSNAFSMDWQGHRGARGLYPENTIGAMKEALQYKVSTLELDVVVSADGEVIVSHEPWMSQEICLDPKGKPVKDRAFNLYKMTFEKISQFDCGSKIHPRFPKQKKVQAFKPLLRTLIQESEKEIKSRKLTIKYNIEIKSTLEDENKGFQPQFKEFTDKVVREVAAVVDPSRVTIQSFDWRVLRYLHVAYPDFKTVALIEEKFKVSEALKSLGFNPTVFSPDYTLLTAEAVRELHKANVLVIPWTVNDVDSMEKLISMGVDGIITDYPDLIGQVKKDR